MTDIVKNIQIGTKTTGRNISPKKFEIFWHTLKSIQYKCCLSFSFIGKWNLNEKIFYEFFLYFGSADTCPLPSFTLCALSHANPLINSNKAAIDDTDAYRNNYAFYCQRHKILIVRRFNYGTEGWRRVCSRPEKSEVVFAELAWERGVMVRSRLMKSFFTSACKSAECHFVSF